MSALRHSVWPYLRDWAIPFVLLGVLSFGIIPAMLAAKKLLEITGPQRRSK